MEKIASLETSIPRRTLAEECQVFNHKCEDESGYWDYFMLFETVLRKVYSVEVWAFSGSRLTYLLPDCS